MYFQHCTEPASDVLRCSNHLEGLLDDRQLTADETSKIERLLNCLSRKIEHKRKPVETSTEAYESPNDILFCVLCSRSGSEHNLKLHLASGHCMRLNIVQEAKCAVKSSRFFASGITCHECNADFKDFPEFNEHCGEMHNMSFSEIHCPSCSFSFPYGELFFIHHVSSMLHKKTSGFQFKSVLDTLDGAINFSDCQCFLCNFNFEHDLYLSHLINYHKAALSTMVLWCERCDSVFYGRSYKRHIDGERHKSVPWFPHICIFCYEEFNGELNLRKHLDTCSRPIVSVKQTPSQVNSPQFQAKPEKKCKIS